MEYLAHGKFKYIDKYKSKAGKWVYKYKQDAGNLQKKAGDLKKQAEKRLAQIKTSKNKKRDSEKGRTSKWKKSNATAYELSTDAKGDLVRTRIVKDSSGKSYLRTEYRNTGEYKESIRSSRMLNAQAKWGTLNDVDEPFPRLKYFLMNFNDKYGPKEVEDVEWIDCSTGKHWVEKQTRNVFGSRILENAILYSYDPSEDKPLKEKTNKRKGKYRAAVKQ